MNQSTKDLRENYASRRTRTENKTTFYKSSVSIINSICSNLRMVIDIMHKHTWGPLSIVNFFVNTTLLPVSAGWQLSRVMEVVVGDTPAAYGYRQQ